MGAQSEAILTELCRRSFLSLWSYPNPFRDQGLKQRGEGKEVCDLLVAFGDDLIIFSDKSCEFFAGGDLQKSWFRWYRKAVTKSVEQIYGAERWIRNFPNRVFADPGCTRRLPVDLAPFTRWRVHRIVIAIGASHAAQEYFSANFAALPIQGGVVDKSPSVSSEPFFIGTEGVPGKFVHVFDEDGLDAVLREFDTAADFCEYLSKREGLFAKCWVKAASERDLVAHYLLTMSSSGHDFLPDGAIPDVVVITEAASAALASFAGYAASKKANRVSYNWDTTIEYFTERWRTDNLVESVHAQDLERSLRVLAQPSRLFRRRLGGMLGVAAAHSRAAPRFLATYELGAAPTLAYTTVVFHKPDEEQDLERYRTVRRNLAIIHARSLKIRTPSVRFVIALVLGQGAQEGQKSEDLLHLDLDSDWSEEIAAETRERMKELGLGADALHVTDLEFPPG